MNKNFLCAAFVLAPSLTMVDAQAAWTAVGVSDEITEYADVANIHKVGNKVKMCDLKDYKIEHEVDGKKFFSSMGQNEYDCKEKQLRILDLIVYGGNMGNGVIVYSVSGTGKWQPVPPGSIWDGLWKIACENRVAYELHQDLPSDLQALHKREGIRKTISMMGGVILYPATIVFGSLGGAAFRKTRGSEERKKGIKWIVIALLLLVLEINWTDLVTILMSLFTG